jgi:hypothetical protein
MHSNAQTVDDYITSLDTDRQIIIETVRKTILMNLPKGYQESMNWGNDSI